jgi:GxxExxY protein
VIGAYFGVYRALGWGFLEAVYRRALCVELQAAGVAFATEPLLPVHHRGVLVGEYRADLIVEGSLIVELKVASQLDNTHRAQLYNYLKATTIEKGLLLNFGPRPALERLILTNDRKLPKPLQL